jgi:hypothetical protein
MSASPMNEKEDKASGPVVGLLLTALALIVMLLV